MERRTPVSLASQSSALHVHAELKPQSSWNENAIEQIERPLHEKREHSRRDRTFENGHVVVQVQAAYDRFA